LIISLLLTLNIQSQNWLSNIDTFEDNNDYQGPLDAYEISHEHQMTNNSQTSGDSYYYRSKPTPLRRRRRLPPPKTELEINEEIQRSFE